MSEWTVERLNALPEGTVIEWLDSGVELTAVKQGKDRWPLVRYTYCESPEDIIEGANPGSIRVVSVPIDALLADETVRVAEDAFVNAVHLAGLLRDEAETIIRAAVAHVIGETP